MRVIFGKPFEVGNMIAINPNDSRWYYILENECVKEVHNEQREDNLEDFKEGNVFYLLNLKITGHEPSISERTKEDNTVVKIIK